LPNENLTMGIIGTATKESEHRAPLYPAHLPYLAPSLRERIFLEIGYGERFGASDEFLKQHAAGLMSREKLFESCDIVLLPKPTEADFISFRQGQILWGWPHCVQGEAITQVGIDKRMTFIAWEAMNLWKGDTSTLHIFHKNNETAGYCSVLHALQLAGITGFYGPKKRAAVLSFGSTGRGAVHALRGQGYCGITVFTQRPPYTVAGQIPIADHRQFKRAAPDSPEMVVQFYDETVPLAEMLADYDIIVNCILQDPDRPVMFIQGEEINRLKPNTLIVDVSCDLQMGFDFARPTSFENPVFTVGANILYYAVDHSPSYLWRAATWEISAALTPYVDVVMGGTETWKTNPTICRAIEIQDGVVLNPKVLRFQNRAQEFPHPKLG